MTRIAAGGRLGEIIMRDSPLSIIAVGYCWNSAVASGQALRHIDLAGLPPDTEDVPRAISKGNARNRAIRCEDRIRNQDAPCDLLLRFNCTHTQVYLLARDVLNLRSSALILVMRQICSPMTGLLAKRNYSRCRAERAVAVNAVVIIGLCRTT